MSRHRKIIVLFEDLEVRKEAVLFAVGLAKRTNAEILFLLLLKFDSLSAEDSDRLKTQYRDVLGHHLENLVGTLVPSSIVVKIGDPLSEFYKFMSDYSSFESAVWGGNEHTVKVRSGLWTGHWLSQVEKVLGCPVLIPKRKAEAES